MFAAVSASADPRFLAVGGFISYIDLMLSVPGISFEVGLPLWAFVKRFQPQTYSGRGGLVLSPTVRPALTTPPAEEAR